MMTAQDDNGASIVPLSKTEPPVTSSSGAGPSRGFSGLDVDAPTTATGRGPRAADRCSPRRTCPRSFNRQERILSPPFAGFLGARPDTHSPRRVRSAIPSRQDRRSRSPAVGISWLRCEALRLASDSSIEIAPPSRWYKVIPRRSFPVLGPVILL